MSHNVASPPSAMSKVDIINHSFPWDKCRGRIKRNGELKILQNIWKALGMGHREIIIHERSVKKFNIIINSMGNIFALPTQLRRIIILHSIGILKCV